MLVDNGVRRDSRVQKQASSMAEHGWEVILLGITTRATAERFRVGRARVVLLPVARTPGRHQLRSLRARRPLAYGTTVVAEARERALAARAADLRISRSAAGQDLPPGPARRLRDASFVPRDAAHRARSSWTQLRSAQTATAHAVRTAGDGALDRLAVAARVRLLGDRAWRSLDPYLWDLELAFGDVVDRLDPDLIHANDFRMLGVGARAKLRARAGGRSVPLVWDAHEFLPGMTPWNPDPRWKPAQLAHEREYAPYADAVVTVSDELAGLLQEEHGLPERPRVVLNCPEAGSLTARPAVPGVRELCGLGPDTPLMVYSGGAAVQRGLHTMVESLPHLPGVACAFVVPSSLEVYVESILAQAERLGVRDRVHVLPFVQPADVVAHLSSADIGVIPILHRPNHEIALITKFFEYSHARLPIVVSDVRTMAAAVQRTGQGEVFRAEDAADLARAVRAVLADPARYRAAYDDALGSWTWEQQATVLDEIYRELDAPARRAARRAARRQAADEQAGD